MSEPSREETPSRVSMTLANVLMALFFLGLAVLVLGDSLRIGAGWAEDGPQAGYFPFFVGLLLAISSIVTIIQTFRREARGNKAFATREELGRVFSVLAPTAVFVLGVVLLGLYLPSIAYIVWFMRRHGKFGWMTTAGVSLGVPLAVFLIFERWFLVPLPKGPIEHLLGF